MAFINRMPKVWFEMVAILIISFIIIYAVLQNESHIGILSTLSIFISALKIIPSVNKILVSLQSIRYSETAVTSLYSDSKMFEGQQILNENDKNKKN